MILFVLYSTIMIDQIADNIFENFPSGLLSAVVTGLPVNAGRVSCNRNSARNLWCLCPIAWTVKTAMKVLPI